MAAWKITTTMADRNLVRSRKREKPSPNLLIHEQLLHIAHFIYPLAIQDGGRLVDVVHPPIFGWSLPVVRMDKRGLELLGNRSEMVPYFVFFSGRVRKRP